MMSNKFYTYKTDFWCARPKTHTNFSIETWRNLSTPYIIEGKETKFDNCKIFDVNYNSISERPENNTKTILCESWEYDTTLFDVSIVQFISLHEYCILGITNFAGES